MKQNQCFNNETLIIFLALLSIIIISGCVQAGDKTTYCETDSDCVPATCCHPTEVVNRNFAPNCQGVACTMVCGGPLDCGCGKPVCENNKCVIKNLQNKKYCQ